MRTTPIVLLAALTLACGGERAPDAETPADSTTAAAPDPRANVFSNAYAEAFTITLAPGQALPAHDGGARTVYALSDYTIRYTQGGETSEQSWKAGEAHFHDAGEHAMENIGTTEAKFLVVARTAQTLAPSEPHPEPNAPSGSGPMQLLLDNDQVRVSEVRMPPGAELPRHPGLARLVYSLSDYTIGYASNDAAAETQSFTTGQAHWHEADEHVITNTGSTEARFLLVQFKR